jgi:hypothetical protein
MSCLLHLFGTWWIMAKAKKQPKKVTKEEPKGCYDFKVRLNAADDIEKAIIAILNKHAENRRAATHLRALLEAGYKSLYGQLPEQEPPPRATKRPVAPPARAVERLADPGSALEDASMNFLSSFGV